MPARERSLRGRIRLLFSEAWSALRQRQFEGGYDGRGGEQYLLPLERRILLSATPAAVAEAVLPADGDGDAARMSPSPAVSTDVFDNALSQDTAPSQRSHTVATAHPTRLVLIDAAVADAESLRQDVLSQNLPDTRVMVLDSSSDGIEQVTEILQAYDDLEAIHLVAHGLQDGLLLGNAHVTRASLAGYAPWISQWSDALTDGADILIYGCNLADSEAGLQLLSDLRILTNADVAASTDDTGHPNLGGNWELEYMAGAVETPVAFSQDLQRTWFARLATINVTQTADVVNGDTTDVASLLASDGGDGISLREAILAVNAGPGGDTLLLGSGTYTLSIAGAHENLAATGDLDVLQSVTISGSGASATIIDASGFATTPDRAFHVAVGATLTINDLTVQGGDATTMNGGGLLVEGTLDADRVIVRDNAASFGAGIAVLGSADLADAVLTGNSASIHGGGLHLGGAASAVLDRIEISLNTAGLGAGIYHNGTLLTATNTTISSNTAVNGGGGILTRSTITMTNSTVAYNDGNSGTDTFDIAGIQRQGSGTVSLTNSILHNPLGQNSSAGFTDNGNNIVSDASAGFGLNTDPMLDILQDNGGFVRTHALQIGSPAIDSAAAINAPSVDARGELRDASPDRGGYEATTTFVVTTTEDSHAVGTLRWAITQANLAPDLNRITFDIADNDARHFYYRDNATTGLSTIATTTLADGAISDFDADHPYQAHSWFSIDLNAALSELTVTAPVLIDGFSQSGSSANTLATGNNANLRIELTASSAGDGLRGLVFDTGSDGSIVRGLTINDFEYSGIMVNYDVDEIRIEGSNIGTDVTGTVARGNGDSGIQLRGSGNVVGGTSVGARNVISGGNSRGVALFTFGTVSDNVIRNNYIGVSSTGVAALGNLTAGIQLYNSDATIVRDNVISGNDGAGIWLRNSTTNTNSLIQNNIIGAGADGLTAIGNTGAGILIDGPATDNLVGGVGAGNTIAHNTGFAIDAQAGSGSTFRVNSLFQNGAGSIALTGGANGNQAAPVIASASLSGSDVTILGTYLSPTDAGQTVVFDFYVSDTGSPREAATWLGSRDVVLSGLGTGALNVTLAAGNISGDYITATATDASGSTSALSLPIIVPGASNASPALTSSPAPAIDENLQIVQTLTATDGDGDTLTFTITGGADQALFSINSSDELLFPAAPDYESPADSNTDNVYEVEITVSDGNGGSDTQTLAITVNDVNEFNVSPITDSNSAADAVDENSANGAVVGITGSAADDDGTSNLVTWTLDDNAGGRFTIDGATGVVTVADGLLLDRETDTTHAITIRATSSDGSSSTRAFTITVDDVNESAISGVTDTDATANAIIENAVNGSTVGLTGFASDADATDNGVTYVLTQDAGGRFAIDSSTGVVTVASGVLLDRESNASHTVRIAATSSDGSSASRTFTIAVLPANDNLPVVTSGSTVFVAENTVSVTTITATDADRPAQTLTFGISGGADAAQFSINTATGILQFRNAPDYEAPTDADRNNVFEVQITVSDGDGGFTSQDLTVHVLDLVETPTAVDDAWTTAEDTALVVSAAGVLANDTDPEGDPLIAALVNRPQHGTVRLLADGSFLYTPATDFHGADTFTYRATDGATSATATVHITVTAVNDVPVAGNRTVLHVPGTTLFVGNGGVLQWARDADGDLLTASLVRTTANGSLTLDVNGDFSYSPDADFSGTDRFAYQVNDGSSASNIGTVTVVMLPVIPPAPDEDDGGGGLSGGDPDVAGGTTPEPESSTTETPENESGISPIDPSSGGPPGREADRTDEPAGGAGVDGQDDDFIAGLLLGAQTRDEFALTSISPDTSVFLARTVVPRELDTHERMQSTQDELHNATPEELTWERRQFLARMLSGAEGTLAELDLLQDELDSSLSLDVSMVGSVATVGSGLTVGFLLWAARGGMLASGLLAQLPAWKLIDPTYVLENVAPEEDDTSLQDVLEEREELIRSG